MEIFREILLGIVQGIMGFLPVSSSGHLVLLGRMFGMDSSYLSLFLCLLKISSLLAVIIILFKDIMKLIIGAFQLIQDVFSNIIIFFIRLFGRKSEGYFVFDTNPYKRLVLMMTVSSAVTYVIARFIGSIAENVSQMSMAMGISFLLSAVILFITDSMGAGKRTVKNLNTFDAVVIGLAQGLSVVPGISRVVMTLAAAMALGFNKSFALKYSYLLALPTLTGYGLITFHNLAGTAISLGNLGNILAGMLCCCILSAFCLRLMMNMAKRGSYKIFAAYGILISIIIIAFNFNLK